MQTRLDPAPPIRNPGHSWQDVCDLEDIIPGSGVCALLNGVQIAVIRVSAREVYAVGNFDPFSKAMVIARGIVGDRGGVPKIASPVYKQSFDLRTGRCLDDETVSIPTYACRVVDGRVQIGVPSPPIPPRSMA